MAFYSLIPVIGTIKAVADTSIATHERSMETKAKIEGVYGMTGQPFSNRSLLLMLLYFITRLKGQKNNRLNDLCHDFVWFCDDFFKSLDEGISQVNQTNPLNPVLKLVSMAASFALNRTRLSEFKYDMLKVRYALEYGAQKNARELPVHITGLAEVVFAKWKDRVSDYIPEWDAIFLNNFETKNPGARKLSQAGS